MSVRSNIKFYVLLVWGDSNMEPKSNEFIYLLNNIKMLNEHGNNEQQEETRQQEDGLRFELNKYSNFE